MKKTVDQATITAARRCNNTIAVTVRTKYTEDTFIVKPKDVNWELEFAKLWGILRRQPIEHEQANLVAAVQSVMIDEDVEI